MPINKELYEAMQRERDAEHKAAERDRRRAFIRTIAMCVAWTLMGCVSFGLALHTTDPGMAQVYRWGAYVITYGGLSFTLLRAYRKGEQRGDW
jgi:hypothetical protein